MGWMNELSGFSLDMSSVYLVGGVILAALGGLVIYRLVLKLMNGVCSEQQNDYDLEWEKYQGRK